MKTVNGLFEKIIDPKNIEKVRAFGVESISCDKEEVLLRDLEQLIDEGQTAAIAYLVSYALAHFADGKKNAAELTMLLYQTIEKNGFVSVIPSYYGAGAPVLPRPQEVLAALVRDRSI